MPLLPLSLILMLGLATGGCAGVAMATLDEKLSQVTGSECAAARMLLLEPWCRSRTIPGDDGPIYCFRTLGTVDCHSEPDPYRTANGRVTAPPPLQAPPSVAVKTAAAP